MRLLLDTQSWLWMSAQPERLTASTLAILESHEAELFLSAASAWEIAIKFALGKLPLPVRPVEYVETRLQSTRTLPLAISYGHALRAGELPFHHHDPFDRLIIAHGQIEHLPIVTADPRFKAYDVDVIEA